MKFTLTLLTTNIKNDGTNLIIACITIAYTANKTFRGIHYKITQQWQREITLQVTPNIIREGKSLYTV